MNDFNSFMDELPLWSAPFGLTLLDTLRFRKHVTVLDIGCGEGFPIIEIASRFGETCRCVGLDPLTGPLKRMAYKKQVYRLPGVHAVQGAADGATLFRHYLIRNFFSGGLEKSGGNGQATGGLCKDRSATGRGGTPGRPCLSDDPFHVCGRGSGFLNKGKRYAPLFFEEH
ncbi:MAG: hypothetical protein ACNA7H_12185 [Desulfotignum sp.]